MLTGNAAAMLIHLPLLLLAVRHMGIAGAALAWVVADLIAASYMGYVIVRKYGISLREFAKWTHIGRILVCAAAAFPILPLSELVDMPVLVRGVTSALAYGVTFALLVLAARIPEVESLRKRLLPAFRGAKAVR
jgi:O-antigen/teichoic acid export membrane protein